MSIYTGNTELKEVFHGSERIKMIYKGSDLIWQYDSVAPSLVVTAPTSTSSSSPTYATSSATYRVTGTVTDADSGVAAVYVNGEAATISGINWYKDITLTDTEATTINIYAVDNAGNQTGTFTRYARYDGTAPSLTVTFPASSSSSSPSYTTSSSTFRVAGVARDDGSGVRAVYVNNEAATFAEGGVWYRNISLSANATTTVNIYAVDNAGNQTSTVTRYVRYDNTNPSLSVSAPAGTSSSSPTYVQNDGTASYTVSGSVSDASGIKSLTVNNAAVTVASNGTWSKALSLGTNTTHTITVVATDKANRTTTVTRYVRVEAYYQQAARIAGTTPQGSLDATLKNSTVCSKIAGNTTAYNIMKSHYKSTMSSYIDSAFNDGLNLLNYKCQTKCYLFHAGNECSSITGGWKKSGFNNSNGTLWCGRGRQNAWTTNAINYSGYSKFYGVCVSNTNENGRNTKIGLCNSNTNNTDRVDSGGFVSNSFYGAIGNGETVNHFGDGSGTVTFSLSSAGTKYVHVTGYQTDAKWSNIYIA